MSEVTYKGERAEVLMADPLISGALSQIKEELRGMFFDLPPEAREQREFLHLMDRARQQFERYFMLLINEAKVERAEILAEAHANARIEAIRRAANAR